MQNRTSQGRGSRQNRADGRSSTSRTGTPLGRGLLASLFVAFTLFVALVLTAQETVLVAGAGSTPTSIAPSRIKTQPVPTATATATATSYPSSTGELPTAEATLTPRPSRTPSRSRTAAPTCVKRWDWVRYTIQPGDTLSSIAARLGISVQRIKDGNCLRQDLIYAGETLLLPSLPYVLPTQGPTRKPPRPTRTPTRAPSATSALTPEPTSTPTATSEPEPTIPPAPTTRPTKTSVPPTATSMLPTKTPVPPTATALPTNTPLPPTATPVSPN